MTAKRILFDQDARAKLRTGVRKLAKAGAQIIAVPAAFTPETGKAHWQSLLRASAIDNAKVSQRRFMSRSHTVHLFTQERNSLLRRNLR